jgi:hypothetical protein
MPTFLNFSMLDCNPSLLQYAFQQRRYNYVRQYSTSPTFFGIFSHRKEALNKENAIIRSYVQQ